MTSGTLRHLQGVTSNRLAIAKRKLRQVTSESKGKIELAILYGSVSKRIENEFSDIDIALISNRSVHSELSVERGIVVECYFAPRKHVLRTIANPAARDWFYWAGLLDSATIICGNKAIFEEFKLALNSVPRKRFDEAARIRLLWMLEGLGHVRSACLSEDLAASMGHASQYRNTVGEFVALANERHYSSHVFKAFREARTFELIPKDYIMIMTELSTTNNIARIRELSTKLFDACCEIASQKGIRPVEGIARTSDKTFA